MESDSNVDQIGGHGVDESEVVMDGILAERAEITSCDGGDLRETASEGHSPDATDLLLSMNLVRGACAERQMGNPGAGETPSVHAKRSSSDSCLPVVPRVSQTPTTKSVCSDPGSYNAAAYRHNSKKNKERKEVAMINELLAKAYTKGKAQLNAERCRANKEAKTSLFKKKVNIPLEKAPPSAGDSREPPKTKPPSIPEEDPDESVVEEDDSERLLRAFGHPKAATRYFMLPDGWLQKADYLIRFHSPTIVTAICFLIYILAKIPLVEVHIPKLAATFISFIVLESSFFLYGEKKALGHFVDIGAQDLPDYTGLEDWGMEATITVRKFYNYSWWRSDLSVDLLAYLANTQFFGLIRKVLLHYGIPEEDLVAKSTLVHPARISLPARVGYNAYKCVKVYPKVVEYLLRKWYGRTVNDSTIRGMENEAVAFFEEFVPLCDLRVFYDSIRVAQNYHHMRQSDSDLSVGNVKHAIPLN